MDNNCCRRRNVNNTHFSTYNNALAILLVYFHESDLDDIRFSIFNSRDCYFRKKWKISTYMEKLKAWFGVHQPFSDNKNILTINSRIIVGGHGIFIFSRSR